MTSNLFSQLKSSSFIRNIAETFIARIIIIILGLVTTVLVTRALGPEGRGTYAVVIAIGATGIQFCNLGLHASNTYFVSRNPEKLSTFLGNSLIVSLVLGCFTMLIVWGVFSVWSDLSPLDNGLLILALLWIPIGLAYLLVQNLLIGIQQIRTYNLIEIITMIVSTCLIVILIQALEVSVTVLFLTGLFILTVRLIWAISELKKHLLKPINTSIKLFKSNIHYGFKAYLAALFSFMVLRADLFMVNSYVGSIQAGYYSIATAIAGMLLMIPEVVGLVIFPKLAAMKSENARKKLTFYNSMAVFAIMLLAALFIWVLGEQLIIILFGEEFRHSFTPLLILCLGILPHSVEAIYRKYINSGKNGFSISVVYIWAGAMVFNIILNYKLIPQYGVNGAATSSSITFLLVFAMTTFIFYKNSNYSNDIAVAG